MNPNATKPRTYAIEFALLMLLGVFSSFGRLDHNDFMYYGAAVVQGDLYKDIYFSQVPLSFFLNKIVVALSPDTYDFIALRLASVLAFTLAMMILAHDRLKNGSTRAVFYIISTAAAGAVSWEIGNYSYAFLLFCISFVLFEHAKDFKGHMLAGLFFGLSIATKLSYPPMVLAFCWLLWTKPDTDRVKAFAGATIGGLIGLSPILYYMITDFQALRFFTVDMHTVFTRELRHIGLSKGLNSIIDNFYRTFDFFILLPVYYLYVRAETLKDRPERNRTIFELLLWTTLCIATIMPLFVFIQYMTPLTVFIFLFSLAEMEKKETILPLKKASVIGVFLIAAAAINLPMHIVKRVMDYPVDENVPYAQAMQQDVLNIVETKLGCVPVVRTYESALLPSHGIVQHPHNAIGPFITRIGDIIPPDYYSGKHPIIDEGLMKIEKSDGTFNALLVGYYGQRDYEQAAISYAEDKGWTKIPVRDRFSLYVAPDCLKN